MGECKTPTVSINQRDGAIFQDIKKLPVSPDTPQLESQLPAPPPYHIFNQSRKLELVFIVSLAAIFSPLSPNIYFPVLGDVSRALNVSMSLATLTVTVYMIVQGITPTFWGSTSDLTGRRPVFLGTFVVYLVANIVLAVSTSYVELIVFRALQVLVVQLPYQLVGESAGVIGDITTSAERRSLVGIFGGVRMLGQDVGPVIGGILSQYLGFRSIAGGVSLLSILVLLPETLRPIAGNGTVPLRGIHKPFIYMITGQKGVQEGIRSGMEKSRVTFKGVFSPLRFLAEKDVFITLFFGSIVYTVWSMVTSSTTDLFGEYYNLTTLEIGLTFLGNGFGCMSGSYLVGYLMDYNHRFTEREYCHDHNYPAEARINLKSHPEFPIEVARMRNTRWIIARFVVIIAFCATGIFTINSAFIIDLYPGASASATAVNNLMRCLIGAAGVAVVQHIIEALTAEYTFVLLAGITVAMTPLLWVERKFGAS